MAEHGHVKNVENLGKAKDFAVSWGAAYQPSNPKLSVANMSALVTAGMAEIDDTQTTKTPYRNATAVIKLRR